MSYSSRLGSWATGFPHTLSLAEEEVRRFLRRVQGMQKDYAAGRISLEEIRQRLMSWSGDDQQDNIACVVGCLIQ